MNKIKSVLLLVAISFILISTDFTGNKNLEIQTNGINDSNIRNYPTYAENHNPILIDGNAELATFISDESLSGDGTYGYPYIIEDITIDTSTATGIEIRNTNVYLIIQNCTVGGINSLRNYGFFLNNTKNVNIKNNYLSHTLVGILLWNSINNTLSGNIINNTNYGIRLRFSSNNTLSENRVNHNNVYGIHLWKSSIITLSGNDASYNSYYGIFLHESINNTLSGNNASYNVYNGFFLYESSSNNTLSGNYASYNNNDGIRLSSSSNNTLSGNNASNNYHNGISLSSSSNNTLSGNSASYNDHCGIRLSSSSNNTLSGNEANNNEYGIGLSSSRTNNNTIYSNDISGNQNVQAFENDDCTDNQWDNGTTGNYWGNDYIIKYPVATNDGNFWDTPYEIDGDCLGIDYFPLLNSIYPNFESPTFTDIPKDFGVNEGYSELNITWFVTDLHPATYSIELDETEVVSATAWISGTGISYDIPDGLLEGDYNITIIVLDESGNIAQDTVIFVVDNGEAPQFTNIPEDFSANEGYVWLSISWTITDLHPTTYSIELDETEILSATVWTNGTEISYNIPNRWLKGSYNITIIVTDAGGNLAQDTVIFTIYDNLAPLFMDVPGDFSADEGYSGFTISWTTTDLHPATYIIELNGTEVVSTSIWTSGSAILYDIPDGLLNGNYNITIIVSDKSGNTSQDTVLFTVIWKLKIPGFPLVNILIFISVGVFILRRKVNH